MHDVNEDSGEAARRRRLNANIALLVMTIIWAVNFSVAKIALQKVTPLAFNALRFPLAAAALYILLRRKGPIALPPRRDLFRVLMLGLLGNVLYQQFFIFGLNQTRAGTASLLLAGTPLITAVLSATLGHERVPGKVWIGVGCTLLGISFVVLFGSPDPDQTQSTGLGALLLLSASCSWAVYTVGARDLVARHGAIAVTAWTLWIGSVGVFLVGLPAVVQTDLRAISPGIWAAVFYAGVLSVGVAYLFWYNGVRELGNTRTSTYSNLVPVITLLVAWLWLGENPSIGQLAGAATIIGGVTLAQSGGIAPVEPPHE
ncbi:MAG: DMT family transporter [Gemmatimonadota bacterium]